MLSGRSVAIYGDELFHCMMSRSVVSPLTEREPEITIEDGYNISRQFLARRLEKNGETVVGKKIGVTSEAVQSTFTDIPPGVRRS